MFYSFLEVEQIENVICLFTLTTKPLWINQESTLFLESAYLQLGLSPLIHGFFTEDLR